MDTANRNYVESLIRKAYHETATAMAMADAYEATDVAEKLRWALDFQRIALAKLATGTNEDGTFGPSHITDTGRGLRPQLVWKRSAELIVSDINAAEAEGHLSAHQHECRGVARDYLALVVNFERTQP